MLLLEKIDMFLLGEAKTGIRLTPLATSMLKKLKGRTPEDVKALVDKISPIIKDNMYEISFDRYDTSTVTPLIIYRRTDDVVKSKVKPDVAKEYKDTVAGFLKGTGLKIVGETKSADWLAFKVA